MAQTFFSDKIADFNAKDPTVIVAIGMLLLLGVLPLFYLKSNKRK